jgi:hypothetical protein
MITLEPEQTTGSDVVEQLYLPQSSPPPPTKLRRIASAADVYAMLSSLGRKDREHFVALLLNCRHQVIRRRTIAIGSLNGVEIHPRELFKPAIRTSSAAIIVAHNHPSGVMGRSALCGRPTVPPDGRPVDDGHIIRAVERRPAFTGPPEMRVVRRLAGSGSSVPPAARAFRAPSPSS